MEKRGIFWVYPFEMIFPGMPITVALSGTSLVTTVPAPIITFFPITQLGKIVALAPTRDCSPTLTPPQMVAPGAM